MTKSEQSKELTWLVGLALLAWFVRIGFAIDYEQSHPWADRPVIDEASYEDWALEIADGDWLGDEVFFQEPLYPYALAVVHAYSDRRDESGELQPNRVGVRHSQAFLGGLGVLLVALVTRRLFGFGPSVCAALLGALYLPWLHTTNLFLKPNLVLPVVAGLAWIVTQESDRRRRWIGLGVLAGLGALLRGNLLLCLPLFAAAPWLATASARRTRNSILVVVGIALVLVPVALRNNAVGGVLALSTSGAGTNLYGGNNEHNPWGRATEFPWVRGIPKHEADDWRHEAERRLGDNEQLDGGDVSSFWLGETLRSLRERPGMHLEILARKAWLVLGRYEVPDNHSLIWDGQRVASLRAPLVGWGLLATFGIVGLCVCFVPRLRGPLSVESRRGATALALFFLAYAGTIVLTVVSGRIRLALVPLLLPFAGFGLMSAWVAVRTGVGRTPLVSLVALSSALLFAANMPEEERTQDLAERDFNNAIYLSESEETEFAAEAIALELAQRYPGSSRVETLLGDLEGRRGVRMLESGQRVQARALLQIALERLKRVARADGVAAREVFRARSVAGWLQLRCGRPEVAERHFANALRFDREDPDLRVAWARARVERLSTLPANERAELAQELRQRVELWRDKRADWGVIERALAQLEIR